MITNQTEDTIKLRPYNLPQEVGKITYDRLILHSKKKPITR